MPAVVIVDDEPLARQGLRQLLAVHTEIRIVGEAASAKEAVAVIARTQPDLVFLDVQMADATGFDVLREIAEPPAIIFVSAHKEHAVEAFAVRATDYLLKPVRPERLAAALDRLRSTAPREVAPDAGGHAVIRLKTGKRIVTMSTSTIVALHAEGDYTSVALADAAQLLVGQSLSELDARLPHPPFIRLGRSLVVNLDHLTEVRYLSRNETHLGLRGHRGPILLGRPATAILRKAQQAAQ